MANKLRIVQAQLNFTVGDLDGNLKKHIEAARIARDKWHADAIVFPELSLTGYPPEDLLLRPHFIRDSQSALQKLIQEISGIYCIIGHPQTSDDQHTLFNACSVIHDGHLVAQYAKQRLPNYGVFDENRYFTPGHSSCVFTLRGIQTGIVICEDLWKIGPTRDAKANGAQLVISPNASPFEVYKHEQRLSVLAKRAKADQLPIIYVNQIGGQDELIFDGGSLAINQNGELAQCAGFFHESLHPVDLTVSDNQISIDVSTAHIPAPLERIYDALVLGLHDYVEKNHFNGVLIGVSGGIDSALTLAIAVDALGKDRVKAVLMPSRYTSTLSLEEGQSVVNMCGVASETISIEPAYKSLLESLAPSFKDLPANIAEENLQARIRANILMGLSNKFGQLVLTTGNRSEIAVGYCTLYGDMAGGYAVLKDIPKTTVYQLADFRNQRSQVIPTRTIARPPTAELAPNQKDEDSLPPYFILDQILEYYLNDGESLDEIVEHGFDRAVVAKVIKLIKLSEYKRRQGAIGPRINHKSFMKDWRYPITNGYKG